MEQREVGRILHVSDLHFGRQEQPGLADKFLDLLQTVPSPDVLIASGDFCWNGEKSSLERAQTFLAKVAGRCQVPADRVFVVPGNHDYNRWKYPFSPGRARRWYDHYLGQWSKLGEWVAIDELNLSLYFFDSNVLGGFFRRLLGGPLREWTGTSLSRLVAGGTVGADALEALRDEFWALEKAEGLAAYPARRKLNSFKVAVLHHHPLPIPVVGEGLLGVALDAGDLMAQLCECDFDLVLHGHQHYPFRAEVSYKPLWDSADRPTATLRVSGAGTLSCEEKGTKKANQFSLIEFDASDSRQITLRFHSYVYYYERWSLSRDQPEEALLRPHREAFVLSDITLGIIASSVGYRRTRNNVELVVKCDGSAICTYETDIEAAVSSLRQVHMRCAGESIVQPSSKFTPVDCSVEMRGSTAVDQDGFFYVHFDSGLPKGKHAEWKLQLSWPPGSFATTAEAAALKRQGKSMAAALEGREWFSHIITVPTDELRMSIRFDGWDLEPDLNVWIESEKGSEHFSEQKTIGPPREKQGNEWVFTRMQPPFALIYIWRWKLPSGPRLLSCDNPEPSAGAKAAPDTQDKVDKLG